MWFEWVCLVFAVMGVANMVALATGWISWEYRWLNVSYFITNLIVSSLNWFTAWPLIEGWFNG